MLEIKLLKVDPARMHSMANTYSVTAPNVKVNGAAPTFDSKKFSVVHKDYVLDYTSPLMNVLQETESGASGLTYRYVYGLEKLSTVITGIPNVTGSITQSNIVKFWYHMNRIGTTHHFTDNIVGKVTSYVSYDDWSTITSIAVLKAGARELDLV